MRATADGRAPFTKEFKCLGSLVTQDLRNDTDIAAQVEKASAQVRRSVKELKKKMLFLQLPLDTALWGAKSRTLTAFVLSSSSDCL